MELEAVPPGGVLVKMAIDLDSPDDELTQEAAIAGLGKLPSITRFALPPRGGGRRSNCWGRGPRTVSPRTSPHNMQTLRLEATWAFQATFRRFKWPDWFG